MQPGNPLLHPQMLACQNFLRDLVRRVIIVVEDGVETRFDPGARQAAKVIGEPHRFAPVLAFLQQHLGADASRAHRKEVCADVHEAEQRHLLPLQPRAMTHHGIQQRAAQLAARSFHEAQVRGQRAELAEAG